MNRFIRSRRPHFRRKLVLAFVLLLLWQSAVFALAWTARLMGVGQTAPDWVQGQYIDELLDPSEQQISSAQTVFRDAIAAFDRHYEQLKEEHDYICREFANRAKNPDQTQSAYGADFRLGPERMFPWHQQVEPYALSAARAGYYDDVVMEHLIRLSEFPDRQASDWQSIIRFARLMGLVVLEEYGDASAILEGQNGGLHSPEEVTQEAINELNRNPANFRLRKDVIEQLAILPYSRKYGRARSLLYRRAFDHATTDSERAEAIMGMGDPWNRSISDLTLLDLQEAIAVILTKERANPDLLAKNLARMAGSYDEAGEKPTTAAFYRAVTTRFPGTPDWGRCTYNQAYLIQEMGHFESAIFEYKRIFPSNVNDREPGPNIMEEYRNYRHRAATQISRAYAEMYDYPRSYYWKWLSCGEYSYHSWCGTCRWSAERRLAIELFYSSVKAGPAFILANLMLAPTRYTIVWIVLGLCGLGFRIIRRRRRKKRGP